MVGAFLLGLILGGNFVWVFLPIARRRGSNPPPPGRKPAPPAGPPDVCWMRSFTHECTNPPTGAPPLKLRRKETPPAVPPEQPLQAQLIRYRRWQDNWKDEQVYGSVPAQVDLQPSYGWGPRQLNPPTPAPGMRREWLWNPSQMAECGGPCWEAQDPRYCDCGALWRDVPIRMDEGQTQRGNGDGGLTTPRLPIKPQPHGGRLFINNKPPKES